MGNGLIVIGWSSQHMILSSRLAGIRHGKWVDCHWLVISTYDSIISFRGILMGSMAHHIWQHHGSVMGNGLIVIGWSSQHMILSSRFGVY